MHRDVPDRLAQHTDRTGDIQVVAQRFLESIQCTDKGPRTRPGFTRVICKPGLRLGPAIDLSL